MADVVEQGDGPEGPGRLPAWLPRLALGLAAVLAVAGLSRSGLLSADDPTPEPEPSSSETTAEPGEPAPRLVAREDDHLLLAAPGEPSPGARLPRDLPADAPLVPMRLRAGTTPLAAQGGGPLLAVAGGRLVRVDPGQPRWRPIGTADAVIAASFSPGRAVVQRGSDLAEVEIATGGVTEADPFPGFDAGIWSARGVLAATGTGALVMTGPPTGGLSALALAWPTGVVRTGTRPQVQDLGMVGPLLAIADDWVITLGPGCPGAACRVQVVSVTRDQARTRDVAPPDGWTFIPGPAAGRTHEALVPVEHLTAGRPDGMQALARLVPGGDNALLVGRTSDVVLGAGLADGPGGSVYLLSASPGADGLQPRVWDPQQPAATRLLLPRSTFPENVRLACVCG